MVPAGDTPERFKSSVPSLAALTDLIPGLCVYSRDNPVWEEIRRINNIGMTTQPLAFIRPTKEDQISTALKFLSGQNVQIGVRNGGHDTYGRAFVEGGINFDMRSMDTISVSPDQQTVHIAGGVLIRDLVEYLESRNLFTPTGCCDMVGYVGWACGGGYGSQLGQYGMGADQILGARVVLANGDVVDTDEADHRELLWALRGAGLESLGIITELRVKLYPKPMLLAGVLTFPFDDLRNIARGLVDLPDPFSGDIFVANMGVTTVVLLFSYVIDQGQNEEAHAYLRNVQSLGKLINSTVRDNTPSGFLKEMAPMFSIRVDYVRRHSAAIAGLSPEFIDLVEAFPPPPGTALVMHNAHGRATLPNPDSVFANRLPHLVVAVEGITPEGADDQTKAMVIKWSDDFYGGVIDAGLKLKQGYWSFTAPDAVNINEFFGAESAQRLRTVKRRYDEDNVFHLMYPDMA